MRTTYRRLRIGDVKELNYQVRYRNKRENRALRIGRKIDRAWHYGHATGDVICKADYDVKEYRVEIPKPTVVDLQNLKRRLLSIRAEIDDTIRAFKC